MLERDIEKRLRDMITAMGCMFEKFVSPGQRGVSDRIVTIPGRPAHIVFLELKQEGKKETKLQQRQREKRLAMGVDARLVVGMAEALAFAEDVRRLKDALHTASIPTVR